MSQIKLGDYVRYSISGGDNPMYDRAGLTGRVVKTDVMGYIVRWSDSRTIYHAAGYIIPEVTLDDPLPPAPESTLYLKDSGRRRLTIDRLKRTGHVNLRIVLDGEGLGYALDPDTALEVAHDLTRMAMEIKRQQRAAEQK